MVKQIEIDGKQVAFKASAAIPRIYRIKFGRDIYKDLRQLGEVHGGRQNGIGIGAGGVHLDLFHGADHQPLGIVAAQAAGDHQVAAQQAGAGGQQVQPQAALLHQ